MSRRQSGRRKVFYLFHRSAGIASAFLGVIVFFTGALVVFGHDLDGWASRDRPAPSIADLPPGFIDRAVVTAQDALAAKYEGDFGTRDIRVGSAPGALTLSFSIPDDDKRADYVDIDPATGAILRAERFTFSDRVKSEPRSSLERFFVQLHVRLLVDGKLGLLLTGVIAILLLLLVGTGLYVHWPRRGNLVRPPRKSMRQWLGDMHTLIGAWSMPFTFILSVTGAFFSFAGAILIPVMIVVAFGGDQEQMMAIVKGDYGVSESEAVAVVQPMIDDARQRAPGTSIGRLQLNEWGGKEAHVVVSVFVPGYALSNRGLVYDGHNGSFLAEKAVLGAKPSVGGEVLRWIGPLHFGNLFGFATQLVWMLLGLLTCVLAGLGFGLWAIRNTERSPKGARVARALLGGCAGLPVAAGATIAAWGFAQGPRVWTAMTLAFFGSLVATMIGGALLPLGRCLRLLFGLGAAGLAIAPLIGFMVTGIGPFAALKLPEASHTAYVDLGFLLSALLLGLAAARLPGFEESLEQTTLAPGEPELLDEPATT
ncbi:MAG: PepSY-associated TM helix domain-containing protein [Myxococcota bacterium]